MQDAGAQEQLSTPSQGGEKRPPPWAFLRHLPGLSGRERDGRGVKGEKPSEGDELKSVRGELAAEGGKLPLTEEEIAQRVNGMVGSEPDGSNYLRHKEWELKRREAEYSFVPQLSADDFKKGCGFASPEVAQQLFLHYIGEGLRSKGELHAQAIDDEAVTMIERSMLEKGWQETARLISEGNFNFRSSRMYGDELAIALKLMGRDYPQLRFFGGGPYGLVLNFSPGDLLSALQATAPERNPYTNRSFSPVVEMININDVVRLYEAGQIDLAPQTEEGSIWSVVTITPSKEGRKEFRKAVIVRRPPATEQAKEAVVLGFGGKAISA